MIPDGFGPTSETFARKLHQAKTNDPDSPLPLDRILVGTVDTSPDGIGDVVRNPKSLFGAPITDSAAGGTAYACGLKTFNGAIAGTGALFTSVPLLFIVDKNKKPCGTILEAAILKGMNTGVVVTSRLSDATPAAFLAHAAHRSMQSLSSEYIVGMHGLKRMPDLVFGGGLCTFIPNDSPGGKSCRDDGRDLIDFAIKNQNATIVYSKDDLENHPATRYRKRHIHKRVAHLSTHVLLVYTQMQLPFIISPALYRLRSSLIVLYFSCGRLPLMGIFSYDHMAYEIDRPITKEPSLSQMTQHALRILKEASQDDPDNGFLLMIEGSRIGSDDCHASVFMQL